MIMSNSSLAELFGISSEDVANKKKGAKGKGGGKTAKKEKKPVKQGGRYQLPVRIRSGYIQCTLTQEQFGGVTLGENEIRTELRKLYPELSGLQFNLVKFSNEFTRLHETMEKLAENAVANDEKDRIEEDDPLDIAEAASEEDYENEDMDNGQDDELDAEKEAAEKDGGSDDGQADEKTCKGGGCWVKLDIQYQEVKKDQTITFPVTIKVGKHELEIKEEASLEEIREAWVCSGQAFL
jgi:hypothetical protein